MIQETRPEPGSSQKLTENPLLKLTLVGIICLLNVGSSPLTPSSGRASAILDSGQIRMIPDFSSIQDVNSKKQQFFDYVENYVVAENEAIAALRAEIQTLLDIVSSGLSLSPYEKYRINEVAQTYRIDTSRWDEKELIHELLMRVDEIPVSLVLAQAANESAWGTSRFVLEGNNIFGEQCFSPGCGMVPLGRQPGKNHEVAYFDSVDQSVKSYFMNINTHDSYRYLRELRAEMRLVGRELDSLRLVMGLQRYSQRGEHYVDELQTIIVQNELTLRDRG